MHTSLCSSSAIQAPGVSPSHGMVRHGAGFGWRLRTVTVSPRAWKWRASIWPTCPLPPGITILINSALARFCHASGNHNLLELLFQFPLASELEQTGERVAIARNGHVCLSCQAHEQWVGQLVGEAAVIE